MNSSSSVLADTASCAQLVNPALGDQLAVGDHSDVGRETFDDLQDVRRQEDGAAARQERVHQVFDLARSHGVDSFERLIEKE